VQLERRQVHAGASKAAGTVDFLRPLLQWRTPKASRRSLKPSGRALVVAMLTFVVDVDVGRIAVASCATL
jgi:hypothetical protein